LNITGVLDRIRKGTFPLIIALSALSVSASAAFYSVSGLSKLFAGASFEVIIMAGSLEVAKLVIASLLYQYWNDLNKVLRTYLTIATVILVLITSMGIYGFLSAAYQDTYRQLTIKENQTAFLEQKRDFYQKDVDRYDQELERISNNISTLSNAKATQIQVRDTTSSTGLRSTVSTAELRLSQQRIEVEEENRKSVQAKREQVADSLQKYQLEILDLENNTEVAGELGPLQYLSGLTGAPMDKIINWLLLVIIFVFDPLAISLVVAANFAFANAFPKKKEKNLIPDVFEDEEIEDWDDIKESEDLTDSVQYQSELDKIEKYYKVYGENSGSLDPKELEVEFEQIYPSQPLEELKEDWQIEKEASVDFEDAEKDVVVDDEATELEKRIKSLKAYLAKERVGGINRRLESSLQVEIANLNRKLDQIRNKNNDDLTKTY
jgi:hypothetical protein